MQGISEDILRVLQIGILLSAQRNMPKLLDTIITEAMLITNCDAGTLYTFENGQLHFKIMRNHTMKSYQGGEDEPVTLPPVPLEERFVSSYVVIHKELVNIEDAYTSDKFDFSGPKRYDQMTGYRTQSMLVIPLENNRGEVVGVVQLMNAMDKDGTVIAFDPKYELIFRSVASQAAIAVTNMNYMRNIKQLFNSLVEVLATAIDERSHYNANHTRNVARFTDEFIDYLNERYSKSEFSEAFTPEDKEQIVMAAWLHDVGKIITPLQIMDKATRLGDHAIVVSMRFDTIFYAEKAKYLAGAYTAAEWELLSEKIKAARALCEKSDTGAVLTDEEVDAIRQFGETVTVRDDGQEMLWLTDYEVNSLSLKYGTLTREERQIMEDHVVITERLLSKIPFTSDYKDVAYFASTHHEKLNGKGYPHKRKAEELPTATRIISMMDVFDALTAKDRPYKKPMSMEKAFSILDKMVADGDMDCGLLHHLKKQQISKGAVGEEILG